MKIGVIGSKGSGKSTVGKLLEKECNYVRIPMARPIKQMLYSIGLSEEEIEGDFKEIASSRLCGKTPREAMQTLGTEWGRNIIHPDVWLNLWREKAEKYNDVVCDDVRFHNEVELIRNMSGIIVRVRRPEVEGSSSHESELYATSLKPDIEIWNDGTVEELLEKVKNQLIVDIRATKQAGN